MVYSLLALASGCLVITSMSLNAHLAKRIGIFRSALVNYIAGLGTTVLVFLILGLPAAGYLKKLETIPVWAFLGGCLGVAVVAVSNAVIPKVPTVYVTLLSFAGQLLAGILIDLMTGARVSFGKIAGVVFIFAGVVYNSLVDRKETMQGSKTAIPSACKPED